MNEKRLERIKTKFLTNYDYCEDYEGCINDLVNDVGYLLQLIEAKDKELESIRSGAGKFFQGIDTSKLYGE